MNAPATPNMRRPRLIALALSTAAFFVNLAHSRGLIDTENLGTPPAVNWQSLEFKCFHEKDTFPPSDKEPEAWFQEANRLYKAGSKSGDAKLLQASFARTLKAAERGHVKAMNNVVRAYLDGDGVQASESKAVEWVEKLMKLNIGMGYYHMGTFLQQGIGVKPDRKAALTYFRKAADLGNPQAQLVSGDAIASAVARSIPDEKEHGFRISRTMLQCALDQDFAEAGYSLGKNYEVFEKKMPQALQAYQAAAKLGHRSSLYALWAAFRDGKKVEKDPVRAACYERLWRQSEADKTKKFPAIDTLCPLPPARMQP